MLDIISSFCGIMKINLLCTTESRTLESITRIDVLETTAKKIFVVIAPFLLHCMLYCNCMNIFEISKCTMNADIRNLCIQECVGALHS